MCCFQNSGLAWLPMFFSKLYKRRNVRKVPRAKNISVEFLKWRGKDEAASTKFMVVPIRQVTELTANLYTNYYWKLRSRSLVNSRLPNNHQEKIDYYSLIPTWEVISGGHDSFFCCFKNMRKIVEFFSSVEVWSKLLKSKLRRLRRSLTQHKLLAGVLGKHEGLLTNVDEKKG